MSLFDVYCLTRLRDRPTVERFLERYVDRAGSEDRGDEELMMVPLGHDDFTPEASPEWERAGTLSRVIDRGLGTPSRGFSVHLAPTWPRVHGASLGFTTDGQLVIGLTTAEQDDLALVASLMPALVECGGAHLAVIAAEAPCPMNERQFLELMRSPCAERSWTADS